MQAWGDSLEEHRRHASFHTEGWPMTREVGFTCSCTGEEMTWRISIPSLREQLPEARASFQRMYSEESRRCAARDARQMGKAQKRARALLHRHLTREQRWTLRVGYFDVVGQDGRTYRVENGSCQNVWALEDGRKGTNYCIVAAGTRIPTYDMMLAQKVMLECDLAHFMSVARRRDGAGGQWENPDGSPAHAAPLTVSRQDVEGVAEWTARRIGQGTGEADADAR